MSILTAEKLCKIYGTGESEVKALDNVSVNIEDGEFVSIMEPPAAANQRF